MAWYGVSMRASLCNPKPSEKNSHSLDGHRGACHACCGGGTAAAGGIRSNRIDLCHVVFDWCGSIMASSVAGACSGRLVSPTPVQHRHQRARRGASLHARPMVGAWEHAPHVAACAGSGPSEAAAAASTAHEYSEQYWTWRGHRVAFTAAGPEDGQAVLMVHGFGASGRHWRRNIPAAAGAGYRVYTLDLLGQVRVWGASVGGFRPWVINVFPTLSTPAPGGEREAPSGLYYGSMGGADFGILGRGHLPASRAGGELCGLACLPDRRR